jgi:DNA-directed RNA polymerase subunit beta'
MVLGIYYLTMDKFKEVDADDSEIVKEYLLDDEDENLKAVKEDAEKGVISSFSKIRVRVIKKASKDGKTVFFKNIVSTPTDLLGRRFKILTERFLHLTIRRSHSSRESSLRDHLLWKTVL